MAQLGYDVVRQTGSHTRLTTTTQGGGEHHLPIPKHDPLRVGTLSGILGGAAEHFATTREDLIKRLFPS